MLYDDGDGSAAEIDRLYDATLAHLASLGDALSVPVLVTAPTTTSTQNSTSS